MRTKHLILFLTAVCLLTLCLVACSKPAEDHSLSDILKKGVMVIATDDTYPPLEYNDNGVIKGYDIDVVAEVARRLGVKAQFVSAKWDGLLTGLAGGQFDAVVSCMNITESRAKEAAFVEYQQWGQVIVMSPEVEPLRTLQELEGKRIAVQIATTSEDMANSVPDSKVTSFESFDTTFMELKNGRCDAIIIDEPVAMYYQKQNPEAFVVTGEADEKAPVGIALHLEAKKLWEAVSQAVADMNEDGSSQEIYDRWFK